MTTPSGAPSPQDEIAGHVHSFDGLVCWVCREEVNKVLESQTARIRELTKGLAEHAELLRGIDEFREARSRLLALLTSPSQPENPADKIARAKEAREMGRKLRETTR